MEQYVVNRACLNVRQIQPRCLSYFVIIMHDKKKLIFVDHQISNSVRFFYQLMRKGHLDPKYCCLCSFPNNVDDNSSEDGTRRKGAAK